MSAERKLGEAATLGDEMADLLFELVNASVVEGASADQANRLRERWNGLMGDCARANLVDPPAQPADYLEEWGDRPVEDTPTPLDWQSP